MFAKRGHSLASVLVLAAAAGTLLLVIALPRRAFLPDETGVARELVFDPTVLHSILTVVAPPESDEAIELGSMVETIVKLGPKALPISIAFVCGVEPLPSHAVDTADGSVHPHALALRERALRAAIATYPPRVRLRHMSERASGADIEVRRVLFQMIGEVEHAEAAATLLSVAEAVEPIQWRRDYISRPFEDAMAKRLKSNPHAVWNLRGRSRGLDVGLCAALMRAASRVPTTLTVQFVADSLGREDELDLAILTALAKLPRRERLAFPDEVLDRVRGFTNAMDPKTRRAGIDACGVLGDMACVETLIGALEDEDPLLVQAAHRALVSLVGVDLGRATAGWDRWFAEENTWNESQWSRLVRDLNGDDLGRATAAMRELASHALFRDEAADEIAGAMPDSGPLVRSAIESLGATASSRAVSPLIDALSSDETTDAAAAVDALKRLTGLDLGPDPETWRASGRGRE